ncbi:MAG: 3-isopropylmalate dehydratase small subunit [Magnetovibrio sp.]|nr:3-isopropylmalate dehydratase small subunit [Magnetovibrio sp.]|tara:strand:+ start:1018 stop:1644 length:627 start_codon:yes stop_codon:yes gene_type:complete
MQAFTKLTAIAAPLFRPNINTDIITPMQFLVGTSREAMGDILFAPWRFNDDGSENPDFILNMEHFREARILIGGPNFACGSSRESAVWALHSFGFRAVIAPSFGGIFANNCFQSGMLPIVLPEKKVAALVRQLDAAPHTATFTIDLETLLVLPSQGEAIPFKIEEFRRTALLEGLDDLGLMKKHSDKISAFQTTDRRSRPWIYSENFG